MLDNAISVLASLPGLLVDLVAVVLAVARWGRHPVVSLLVTVGIGLHLAGRVSYWLAPLALSADGGTSGLRLFFAGAGLVSTVGSGLIVAAVFTERPVASAEPLESRW